MIAGTFANRVVELGFPAMSTSELETMLKSLASGPTPNENEITPEFIDSTLAMFKGMSTDQVTDLFAGMGLKDRAV